MRINRIDTFRLRAQLKESFRYSQWSYSHRETTLVCVQTADGHFGWGEGYGPASPVEATIRACASLALRTASG